LPSAIFFIRSKYSSGKMCGKMSSLGSLRFHSSFTPAMVASSRQRAASARIRAAESLAGERLGHFLPDVHHPSPEIGRLHHRRHLARQALDRLSRRTAGTKTPKRRAEHEVAHASLGHSSARPKSAASARRRSSRSPSPVGR